MLNFCQEEFLDFVLLLDSPDHVSGDHFCCLSSSVDAGGADDDSGQGLRRLLLICDSPQRQEIIGPNSYPRTTLSGRTWVPGYRPRVPGTDVGTYDQAYVGPAMVWRRCMLVERA
eukprot:1474379-Rhodomonas_salina.1